ncbi:ferritin family protein [Thermanaerosceptrum fracticalcis]|nr:ferritin-like domain-containing protein [Thermanaerosceptrum fracticalcis]
MAHDRFTQLILESYFAEMQAHHHYMTMAQMAPTEEARHIMMMNAQDEHRHAEAFEKIYEELTGTEPRDTGMHMMPVNENMTFLDHVRMQLFDEYADFRKYKDMYLMTDNPEYRDTLFNAMHDEFRHAMLLTYLLN